MGSTAKVLVPDREWLVTDNNQKVGAITKCKRGYTFHKNGKSIGFKNLSEMKSQLGIALFEESIKNSKKETVDNKNYYIYDFPCSSKPYDPLYSVREKIPLYAKSPKSKSQYCAGYYVVQFRKGWVKSFCPKLITLQRYPYYGPFKTEAEMKSILNTVNKI